MNTTNTGADINVRFDFEGHQVAIANIKIDHLDGFEVVSGRISVDERPRGDFFEYIDNGRIDDSSDSARACNGLPDELEAVFGDGLGKLDERMLNEIEKALPSDAGLREEVVRARLSNAGWDFRGSEYDGNSDSWVALDPEGARWEFHNLATLVDHVES